MCAYFKDFSKDVKDLLSKNYSDAGKWKLESKFKGPKDTLYVNPQASSAGVSVDVEYNLSCCPTKTKTNVTAAGDLKSTVTFEEHGHKVEAVVEKTLAFEISHETKHGKFAVNDKITKKAAKKEGDATVAVAEFGAAVQVIDKLQVGAGVTYPLNGKNFSWTAGARYADAGFIVSVVTAQLQSYTTSVLAPFKFGDKKITVAAQVDCGHGDFKVQVGADAPCLLAPANTVRVRIDKDLKWAAAYIVKFADNWKAAVSIDDKLNPGLLLTRE